MSEEKRRCPSCGGGDTRHSVRGGIVDAIMQMFHRRPFRCRSCRRRFYAHEDDPVPQEVDADEDEANEPADRHFG